MADIFERLEIAERINDYVGRDDHASVVAEVDDFVSLVVELLLAEVIVAQFPAKKSSKGDRQGRMKKRRKRRK